MSYSEKLLELANEYCKRTGRAKSGVAMAILNDSKFFDRVQSGSGCTMKTYEKVIAWFDKNMPQPEPKKTKKSKSN